MMKVQNTKIKVQSAFFQKVSLQLSFKSVNRNGFPDNLGAANLSTNQSDSLPS